MTLRWVLALALAAGCGRDHVSSCDDDLTGVWRASDGRRFDVIAGGTVWEMYPMFDDRPAPADLPAGIVAAPGVLDLPRGGGDGTFTRRYERGSAACAVRAVAHLRACKGDRVDLDVRPPAPPPDPATCPDGGVAVSDPPTERWSLTRE